MAAAAPGARDDAASLPAGASGPVQQLLHDATTLEFAVQREIHALETFTGPNQHVAAASSQIRQDLQQLQQLVAQIDLAAVEQDDPALAAQVRSQGARHAQQVAELKAGLRTAHQAYRRSQQQAAQKQRQELLDGAAGVLRQRRSATAADLAANTRAVSAGLRRTRDLMNQQLEHSAAALKELQRSSSQLTDTQGDIGAYSGSVAQGGAALRRLARRDATDRFIILFAFSVFVLIVLYVLHKRLIGAR